MSVGTRDYIPELVRPKVLARLAPAQVGLAQMAFGEALRSDSFRCAPLNNPPKATGITDTVTQLKDLIVERRILTPDDYQQVCLVHRSSYPVTELPPSLGATTTKTTETPISCLL